MSANILATLDIEDLSAKQLRKVLNGISRSHLPYSKKTKGEQEQDAKESDEENESLVKLHQEQKDPMKLAKGEDSDSDEKPEEKSDEKDAKKKKKV